MIEIKEGSKGFGKIQALKDINLKIENGSIFGLIGPNGAGKTTLIKCMTGIYKLDKGFITFNGNEVFESKETKMKIGYVADENNYFGYFKVKDVVTFYKLTYESFNNERFLSLNEIFKVPLDTIVDRLSKGMKMRFSIMLSLSIMPKFLILDEPTNGLDPIAKRQVMKVLMDDVAERGTTIFISSHLLSELERICDSIAIMDKGEIKYCSSLETMKKCIRKFQVVFKEEAPQNIEKWEGVLNVQQIGRVYNIITKNHVDELKVRLQKSNISFQEEIDLSLEDMFIYSIGGEWNNENIFK